MYLYELQQREFITQSTRHVNEREQKAMRQQLCSYTCVAKFKVYISMF